MSKNQNALLLSEVNEGEVSKNCIISGLKEATENASQLEKTIGDIFKDCLIRRGEEDYIIAEGIDNVSFFNAGRLEKHKEKLERIINSISGIEDGISFANMPIEHPKNNTIKYNPHNDRIIKLGVAIDLFEYVVPRTCIDALPAHVPFVVLKGQNLDPQVIGDNQRKEKVKVNVLTK